MTTQTRPPVARRSSRIPGGFDVEDDLSPIRSNFEDTNHHGSTIQPEEQTRKNLDGYAISGLSGDGADEGSTLGGENDTFLQEKDMRRRLEDLDSTFLQDASPIAPQQDGTLPGNATSSKPMSLDILSENPEEHSALSIEDPTTGGRVDSKDKFEPALALKTPAPQPEDAQISNHLQTAIHDPHMNTSALETMSSSPTAAAAARTVSRAVSMASIDQGYETADDSKGGIALGQDSTPMKAAHSSDSSARSQSPTPTKPSRSLGSESDRPRLAYAQSSESSQSPRRPPYVRTRAASQRSSRSSYTNNSLEASSDLTLGADFGIQPSGPSAHTGSTMSSRPTDFSRSVSLGSIASGISALGESEGKVIKGETQLHTLTEEVAGRGVQEATVPQTPGHLIRDMSTPTDTVIAQHVKDIQVPATLAREYQSRQRQPSPDKKGSLNNPAANRNSKNLTLKEQSSTIDRLVKENFDLKLKITFLDEALNRRSDEGVKAMISENVDLRTAKFKSAKEMRELKRSIRDLERKLKEKTEELVAKSASLSDDKGEDQKPNMEAFHEFEDEVLYLRERVTTYEKDIESMRNDTLGQETERKRFADAVKRFGETSRGTDIGTREEVVNMPLFLVRMRDD